MKREIYEFTGVYWEPNHHKIAIHTLAKRPQNLDKQDYTVNAKRHGIDIYECCNDPKMGFEVKLIGFHASEKV